MNYSVDSVKAAARKKQLDFIARELSFMKPERMRAFCLETKEGAEITQVYDALGLPRSNITVAQPDKAEALAIREQYDVQVSNTFDLPFLEKTAKTFKIISLDYTGQQTDEALTSIATISARGLLGSAGVLVTNFSGNRESSPMQRQLKERYAHHIYYLPSNDKQNEFTSVDDVMLREWSVEQMREGISAATINALREGKTRFAIPPIVTAHPNVAEANESLRNAIRQYVQSAKGKETIQNLIEQGHLSPTHVQDCIKDPTTDRSHWITHQLLWAGTYLGVQLRQHIPDSSMADLTGQLLANLLLHRFSNGYYPFAMERYRYTSNKGSNMLFDLFSLRRADHLWEAVDNLAVIENGNVRLNPKKKPYKRWYDELRAASREFSVLIETKKIPQQTYLGSALPERISVDNLISLAETTPLDDIMACYRPQRKNLTREETLKLSDLGIPAADIEKHFGIPKMRVAGWKAHRTQGTYETT